MDDNPMGAQSETERRGSVGVGPPASLAGFEDRARFALMVNEEVLGSMESTWNLDGSFDCQSRLTLAGQTVETSVTIVPDSDGRWTRIVMKLPVGTLTVDREGSFVTRRFGEKTSTLETQTGVLLFDNEAPTLMSQALRLYDHERGGVQKFPLLVGAKVAAELTLDVIERAVRSVGGRDLALTKYVYGIPGADLHAWADAGGKLYLIEVPAQSVVLLREGFEALQKPETVDPLLSAPRHEVLVDCGVGVPMRDGIELSTDIYRPVGLEKAPVLLVRTPYKKELHELQAKFYARRGYVCAVQDCRGRFGSPGIWEPFVNEGQDGYDAIEWLAQRPYADGRVGMIGGSYLASAQWLAAAQNPPHLVTIIPNVSPPDPFYNVPYEYGAFMLWGAIWWSEVIESGASADISGAALRRIHDKKYAELLRALPVIDLDIAVLGRENPYWRKWIQHPTQDAYWESASFMNRLESVRIPVFHQSGWFDGDGIGTKLNYARMVQHHHPYQKLTLGPWGHTDTAQRMVCGRDFGENAIVDLQRDYLRWLDRWLKGIENGIETEPLVSLFVMGANEWVHGKTYPLPSSELRPLYLTSGGNANTSRGDGRLTFVAPASEVPPDRYDYDPADPTPEPRLYRESEQDEKRPRSVAERKTEAEEHHQRLSEQRKDILVYETEPLEQPLTFAGPISATLYAASSAQDTDWFVTLCEVDADGKVFPLTKGKLRARYRESMTTPELLRPNEIYEYELDLWQTAIRIPSGARLRVEIASAAFPLFSRNLNTGGHNETETDHVVAHQTIFHDQDHPSHVLLPVIRP
jgi:putative CocE/NonD family hydrolase